MFSIKKFFNRFQTKKAKSLVEEEELYALDSEQLKHLIEKNISFDFFQLEALNKSQKLILQKAKLKTKEEIVSELKTANLNQPIVLICSTGERSRAFSAELRDKGFINVYFVKKGFYSL